MGNYSHAIKQISEDFPFDVDITDLDELIEYVKEKFNMPKHPERLAEALFNIFAEIGERFNENPNITAEGIKDILERHGNKFMAERYANDFLENYRVYRELHSPKIVPIEEIEGHKAGIGERIRSFFRRLFGRR